jgi:hypothetical protein
VGGTCCSILTGGIGRYSAAGEPVWAQPHDGSAPLTNNVRGKVVLLARSKAAVHIITQVQR